ncbi:LPXTG cell wall anchor domain-containing protein [Paenibacillus sp. y28]|uniref:LPXTG cell wall anchor domain-containing protein n=1 Tax=Paenibacillus sp. y28 TaxID=3129110 RepID=UPI0030181629
MRTCFFSLLLAVLLLPSAAWAHIANEDSLYEDIAWSEARDSIVLLSGLGIIPYAHGASLFKPKEPLSRADLAYWAGSFAKAAGDGAEPEAVRQAALAKGLVSGLEGNATPEDVNRAFFQGQASIKAPSGQLSREGFATLMSTLLTVQVNGKTIVDAAGYAAGPSGTVEKVEAQETKGADGRTSARIMLTIGGQQAQLNAHPKVLHAPSDAALWEGKTVQAAWLGPEQDGKRQLQVLVFAPSSSAAGLQADSAGTPNGLAADQRDLAKASEAAASTGSASVHTGHAGHTNEPSHASEAGLTSGQETLETLSSAGEPIVPIVIGGIVLLLAGWLFLRKRKQ